MALPPNLRLRGHRTFDRLYRNGRRFHGTWMVLRTLKAEESLLSSSLAAVPTSPLRCAVVISSKVSKRSVSRNRLRRLIHAWLQVHCGSAAALADPPQWLLFSLKPGCAEADPEALLGECASLLRKAGLSR
ncbi:ribonuclease P protein component [Synechococcus sp. CS-1325]|uniref:ribonuclease P protein component n=1 Tax=unclassified Synechococcus TaxID=2626047 RepID=UPI000DB3B210|nr:MULTISPECIES: ribonuclease P protein component [unclassified Synechococcus]MCT0198764.1 ribonuclease P protein component [Synechococcus sp. CS-1325]MCT0231474.1 ribonuclease P protein component [Synechococcus sp. CS-1324]PZU99633.1 MAG: ribonuclease P protein component [Cyanobium sp.]PZV03929.1 MAG: ribonuclease P protein component [Cyanobium sp.]